MATEHPVTERSEFFRAARKPEWLTGDPKKPVDLKDEDAEVFDTYVNCVYFGCETLELYADEAKSCTGSDRNVKVIAGFRALIQVYLLADKLQDLTTANMVIDEIMRFSDLVHQVPTHTWSDVYSRTPRQSPLRALMRDYWVYEMIPTVSNPLKGLSQDFMEDILLEFLRVKAKDQNATINKAFRSSLSARTKDDKCLYHQHDDKHPRCVPKPKPEQ